MGWFLKNKKEVKVTEGYKGIPSGGLYLQSEISSGGDLRSSWSLAYEEVGCGRGYAPHDTFVP